MAKDLVDSMHFASNFRAESCTAWREVDAMQIGIVRHDKTTRLQ